MKNRFTYLIYAFILDAVFLFAAIQYIKPDPKGIGLAMVIVITGTAAAFAGTFSLFFEFKKESFLYSWASITCLINFSMLYGLIKSMTETGQQGIDQLTNPINLIMLFEGSLGVYMLSKFFKKE